MGVRVRWMLCFAGLAAGLAPGHAAAATLVVDDDAAQCPHAAYASIQQAVDAADAGDAVEVCAGEYQERVRIAEPLRLVGARAGVDARQRNLGDPAESVVQSSAPLLLMDDDVTVDGFTIRVVLGEDDEGQGIFTYGSGYAIVNNVIDGERVTGVALTTIGGKPVTIARNHFRGRLGIAAEGEGGARNVVIRDNLFRNASVRLVDGRTSDVQLAANVFRYEPDAASPCAGPAQPDCRPSIYVALTRDVTLEGNAISGAGPYAIRVRENDGLRNRGNTFTGGAGDGVQLARSADDSIVAGNAFADHAGAGVRLAGAAGYLVEDNRIEGSGVGIEVDAESAGNRLSRNEVSRSGELDCRDASTGDASFGTANRWQDNRGITSAPAGLCSGGTP